MADKIKAIIMHGDIRDTVFVINLFDDPSPSPSVLYKYDNTRLYTYQVVTGFIQGVNYEIHVVGKDWPTKDTVPAGADLQLWQVSIDECISFDDIHALLLSKGMSEKKIYFDSYYFTGSIGDLDTIVNIGVSNKKCIIAFSLRTFERRYGILEGRMTNPTTSR